MILGEEQIHQSVQLAGENLADFDQSLAGYDHLSRLIFPFQLQIPDGYTMTVQRNHL